MGCPRPKYFFSGLPNLLPQKIRLPPISFLSGVSYIWGSYIWGSSSKNQIAWFLFSLESVTSRGSYDWKNFPNTARTDRQTDITVTLIYKINYHFSYLGQLLQHMFVNYLFIYFEIIISKKWNIHWKFSIFLHKFMLFEFYFLSLKIPTFLKIL